MHENIDCNSQNPIISIVIIVVLCLLISLIKTAMSSHGSTNPRTYRTFMEAYAPVLFVMVIFFYLIDKSYSQNLDYPVNPIKNKSTWRDWKLEPLDHFKANESQSLDSMITVPRRNKTHSDDLLSRKRIPGTVHWEFFQTENFTKVESRSLQENEKVYSAWSGAIGTLIVMFVILVTVIASGFIALGNMLQFLFLLLAVKPLMGSLGWRDPVLGVPVPHRNMWFTLWRLWCFYLCGCWGDTYKRLVYHINPLQGQNNAEVAEWGNVFAPMSPEVNQVWSPMGNNPLQQITKLQHKMNVCVDDVNVAPFDYVNIQRIRYEHPELLFQLYHNVPYENRGNKDGFGANNPLDWFRGTNQYGLWASWNDFIASAKKQMNIWQRLGLQFFSSETWITKFDGFKTLFSLRHADIVKFRIHVPTLNNCYLKLSANIDTMWRRFKVETKEGKHLNARERMFFFIRSMIPKVKTSITSDSSYQYTSESMEVLCEEILIRFFMNRGNLHPESDHYWADLMLPSVNLFYDEQLDTLKDSFFSIPGLLDHCFQLSTVDLGSPSTE